MAVVAGKIAGYAVVRMEHETPMQVLPFGLGEGGGGSIYPTRPGGQARWWQEHGLLHLPGREDSSVRVFALVEVDEP